MPVSIRNVRYEIAEKYHYGISRFRKKVAPKLIGPRGGKWNRVGYIRMSCAIRVSIALYRAGVRFQPPIKYKWTRPSGAVYPSSAGEYPNLLQGRENVNGPKDIEGRRGVICFGGSGIGHVTLWNGKRCHFDPGDSYWAQPNKYFWEMA